MRLTAAMHTAEPGTPRTSAPVGAAAAAAAAAASLTSPPGSVASSALPPTAALPSTPASGLTGGLSGLSGLTVFETALAGEEFYEREGYYPMSPGRAVARTGSFRRAVSRAQLSPAGVRTSGEHRYSGAGPDSSGAAESAQPAAEGASSSNVRPDASAGSITPGGHQPATTYAQALMLPTEEGDADAVAQEAAVIMHAGAHTSSPPPVAEAQPEESAALSRPDTESSGDEEGGPEVPAQAGADTDAGTSAPGGSPEMSFLSRAPEESDNLPPTHASFILPSRFSRDLSRSSDSRLRAQLVTAEDQVELSPDTAALQPPMAGGSLPRIGNRGGGGGGAHTSAALGEGETTDWARSQSTSDQPWELEAPALTPGEALAQRQWCGLAHGEEVKAAAAKNGAVLTAEERHFSWCAHACADIHYLPSSLWYLPLITHTCHRCSPTRRGSGSGQVSHAHPFMPLVLVTSPAVVVAEEHVLVSAGGHWSTSATKARAGRTCGTRRAQRCRPWPPPPAPAPPATPQRSAPALCCCRVPRASINRPEHGPVKPCISSY